MHCLLVIHPVSPHQVAENSIKRDFLLAIDLVDLVELLETWGDATMHGEVLLRDVACDGHCIENVHEQIIHLSVKALHYLVTESKGLCHVSRLVVTSEHDHVFGEVELDGKK